MSRRGRRSLAARQRRYINRLISQESYRDNGKAESINTLTKHQIEDRIREKFGTVATPVFLKHARGEVLSDSRGEGVLQQINYEDEN